MKASLRASSRMVVAVLAISLQGAAQAALITKPYSVPHRWTINLPGGVPQQYRYTEAWRLTASAKTRTQPKDTQTNNNMAGPFVIPPARNDLQTAASIVYNPVAFSDANCRFQPGAPAGGRANGTMTAFGSANLDPALGGQGAGAYSACNQGVQFLARDRRGQVVWDPRGLRWDRPITGGVAIGTTGIIRDPVSISAIDLDNGDLIEAELISVLFELPITAFAEMDQNGILQVDAPDGAGSISISIDSPIVTSGLGSLNISFLDGFVTASDDTGIFDGLLPGIGSSSMFTIDFGPDVFTIDFDLGRDSVNGFDYTFSFGNGAEVELAPGPATWTLLVAGLVGVWLRRSDRQRDVCSIADLVQGHLAADRFQRDLRVGSRRGIGSSAVIRLSHVFDGLCQTLRRLTSSTPPSTIAEPMICAGPRISPRNR